MSYENKLYIDSAELGGRTRYVMWNLDLLPMIWKDFNLSNVEQSIFMHICMVYDNAHESHREPLKLSYDDIARIVNCSRNGVRKALQNLIKKDELIVQIGTRNGKAKGEYMPNIKLIHSHLENFINNRSMPPQ